MSRVRWNSLVIGLAVAALVTALTLDVRNARAAATYTWGIGSGDIDIAGNWGGTVPSTTGDTAYWNGVVPGSLTLTYTGNAFNGGSGDPGVNLFVDAGQLGSLSIVATNATGLRVNSLTLAPGAGAFSFGNGSGTLAVTLSALGTHIWTNNSSNMATINSDVTFGAGNSVAQNLILSGAGNWLFNNNINNAAAAISISQSGAGVTTLAGNNGYTGATTVAQGTLSLTGSLGATAISVAPGATFSESSGGLIGGAASLTTSGLTTLAGSNTFTGVTLVPSGGTLTLANVGALAGSTFDASGAGLLNFGALSSATFGGLQGTASGTLALPASFNLSVGRNNANTTFSGSMTGTGSVLTKIGNGVLTLAGTNSYSGGTTISVGGLAFSTTSAIPSSGAITLAGGAIAATPILASGSTSPVSDWLGKLAVGSTGAVALTNGATDSEALTLPANISLGAFAGGSATYSGALSPTSATFYLGGGGGTLFVTQALTGGNSLAVGQYGGGGNVVLTQAIGYSGATTISAGTLTMAAAANQTFSGVIGGNGVLAASAGTITLANSTVLSQVNFDASGAGKLNFGSLTSATFGGLQGASGTLSMLNASGAAVALTVGNNNTNTVYAGILTDSNSGATLTKIGTGQTSFTGHSTYKGLTTVNGGTLALGVGGGTAALLSPVTINAGAFVNLTATDALGFSSTATVIPTINVNGGVINDAGGNEGFLTQFNLTGGTMTSTNGGYNFSNNTAGSLLPNIGITTLASTASSVVSGGVVIRGTGITFNVASGTVPSGIDLAISGNISGGGNIAKSGLGLLLLSGTETNATTSVTAGTLSLTGALNGGGAISVSPGAVFTESAAGLISGAASLAVSGAATLAASNTYTGITSANGGSLTITNAAALQNSTLDATGAAVNFAGPTSGTVAGLQGSSGTVSIAGVALSVGGNAATTYSGNLTGSGGSVIKNGSGALILAGTNTYTGGTTIISGALGFGASSSVPSSGSITLAGGGLIATPVLASGSVSPLNDWLAKLGPSPTGAIALTAGASDTESVTLPANVALGAAAGGSAVFAGSLTPTGGVYYLGGGGGTLVFASSLAGGNSLNVGKFSAGNVFLNAGNSYSGNTTINAGSTLTIGDASALGSQGSGGVYSGLLIGSGALVYSGSSTASSLTFSANNSGFTGSIGVNFGTLSLTGTAGGSLAVGGGTFNYAPPAGQSQTFTGLIVNQGDSTINNSSGGGTLALGGITRNVGGTVSFPTTSGILATTAPNNTTSNGVIAPWAFVGSGASTLYAYNTSNSTAATLGTIAGLVISGTNVLSSASNTWGGMPAGTAATNAVQNYNVTASATFPAAGSNRSANTIMYSGPGNASQAGATLTINGFLNVGGGTLTDSQTLVIGASNDLVVATMTNPIILSGVISNNSGALTKVGQSFLTLSNANTFAGNVTISGGTLNDANAENSLNPVAGGLGNPQTAGRTVTVNNGGVLNFAVANALGNTSTTPALALVVNNGGMVVSPAALGGSNVLGNVTINGGTLTTGNGASASNQSYLFGGTVTFGGNSPSAIIAGGVANNGINLGISATAGAQTTFNVGATGGGGPDLIVSAPLADSGNGNATGLIKSGLGSMQLTGVNTYHGTTSINLGTLNINADAALGTPPSSPGTNITFGGNGTLQFAADQISLSGSRNIAISSGATATFDTQAFNNPGDKIGGIIAGAGGLAKAGAGILTLLGSNTYSGPTSINNGTLILDAAAGAGALGPTAVNIGGSGSLLIRNTTSIAAGGSLAATAAGATVNLQDGTINTLNVGGGLTLANGSVLDFDLAASAGSNDLLAAAGLASVSGTTTVNLNPTGILTSGTYGLITASSGLGGAHFVIGAAPSGHGIFYSFGASTATQEVLTVTAPAPLTTGYWTGAASRSGTDSANPNWGAGTTTSNWSASPTGLPDADNVPNAGTDVIFTAGNATPTSGATLTTQLDAAYSIKGLTIGVPASVGINSTVINPNGKTLTIGADGLTLAGTSAASATLATGSVRLSANQNWANNSNSLPLTVNSSVAAVTGTTTLTLNGAGAGGVALNGALGDGGGRLAVVFNQAGITQLNAANTFTGGVTINGGVVQLGNSAALNAGSPNLVAFGAGSTGDLQLAGISAVAGGLTTNATTLGTPVVENANGTPATLTLNGSAPATYAGVLQDGTGGGPLTLTMAGGVQVLSGNNTYSGGTNINGGALSPASAGAIPGNIAFGGGTLRYFSPSFLTDYSGQIFNSAGPIAIDTNGQSVTFANALDASNSGGLTKLGSGLLSLTGGNLFTGPTTVSSGTLTIADPGVLGAGGNYGNNIAIAGGALLNVNTTTAQTFGGSISGSGALAQNGTGVLVLTAVNTYGGGTTVFGPGAIISLGNNVVGSESATTPLGSGTVSISGGGQINAAPGSTGTTYVIGNAIALNGGTFWQADGIQQLSGPLSVGPSGGTLLASWNNKSLSVTNVISGSSTLTIGNNGIGPGGVVIVTNSNSFSGTVDVSGNLGGAVMLQLTNSTAFANATVNADGGAFTYGPANMIFGALTGNGNFTLPTGALIVGGIGANTTYNGAMGGAGGLSLQGPGGSLTLTAAQTFTGPLTVNGGTLNLPVVDSTFGPLGGAGGAINLGGAGINLTANQTAAGTYAGTITGSGNLHLGSASTAALTLSGPNTFAGNTTVNGGTLRLDYTTNNNQKLGGSGGMLAINNGATVALNGGSYIEQQAATAFVDGVDQIVRTSGSSLLGLGNISVTPGALVSFGGNNIATTTTPNTSGILGPQYTIGLSAFATNSGGTITTATVVPFISGGNFATDNVLLAGNGNGASPQFANTLTIQPSGAGQSLNLAGDSTPYVITSGGLLFTGSNDYTIAGGSISSGASQLTVIQNAPGTLAINSAIVDNSGLTLVKLGTGTLALGGANAYTGPTTVAAGTLRVTAANGLGSAGQTATLANGTTLDVQANLGAENLTLGGSGVGGNGALINSNAAATGTVGGSVTLAANTSIGGAGQLNITGNISDSGFGYNLTMVGPGTTTLSGFNNWLNTTVAAGTLAVGGASALPASNLSFTGAGGGLSIGSGVAQSLNQLSLVSPGAPAQVIAIGGASGSLTLSQSALQVGATATAAGPQTLDMSRLGTFVYNNSFGSVEVGGSQSGATGDLGTLILAQTNSITANLVSAGWFNGNNGTGPTTSNSGTINLGQMNTIDANRIGIADGTKNQGTVQFLAGLTNPTLVLRDASGGNSATMVVGFNNSGQVPTFGTIDLVAGVTGNSTLDAVISSGTIAEDIGNGGGGTGQPATGVFNMGQGTLDAQSLVIGQSLRAADSGSLGIFGGRASIGTLMMGNQSSGATSSPTATVTLAGGGTLDVTALQPGSGTATQIFNWNSGTIANLNSPVQGATGLSVTIPTLTMAASGTHTFSIDPGQSGTVSSNIGQVGGSASLFMTGGGTLTLSGTDSYTGITEVLNGTLVLASPSAIEDGNSLYVGSPGSFFAPVIPASAFPASAAISPVPEPGSLALLAAGAVATLIVIRRGKRFGTARGR